MITRAERALHDTRPGPESNHATSQDQIQSPANVALHHADLFTWWAPWRNMKQRNIGWRVDLILASRVIADRTGSCVVQREFGTSDHGPVIADFEDPPGHAEGT